MSSDGAGGGPFGAAGQRQGGLGALSRVVVLLVSAAADLLQQGGSSARRQVQNAKNAVRAGTLLPCHSRLRRLLLSCRCRCPAPPAVGGYRGLAFGAVIGAASGVPIGMMWDDLGGKERTAPLFRSAAAAAAGVAAAVCCCLRAGPAFSALNWLPQAARGAPGRESVGWGGFGCAGRHPGRSRQAQQA